MKADNLIAALKSELKSQSITYQDLGKELNLSEAAIKRMFSQKNFSLHRLEQICLILGIDEKDFFRKLVYASDDRLPMLSMKQEESLAVDPDLLGVFYFLVAGKSQEDLKKYFKFDDQKYFKYLKQLDDLRLIELHPMNRIKFLVTQSPQWIQDGPLMKRYGKSAIEQFYTSDFKNDDELLEFHTGTLSKESLEILKRKINELFKEFDNNAKLDRSLTNAPTNTYWMLTGLRQWDPIGVIRRQEKSKN